MSHLPPQNPNRDPRIEDAGYVRNAPAPVPYGRYNPPVGQTTAAGFGSIDPVLMEVQRKRSATRKVSVAGSIIGLITMMIQIIVTTYELLTVNLQGEEYLELALLALLMMIAAPFIVGLGWIVTFILGLIACIRANSRTPQVQPDGWIEAKMPTSALLAASIVAGLPTLIIFLTWFWQIHHGIDDGDTHTYVLYTVLVASYLVQILIAVGFIVLLRRSKALDPSVRVS
ncbi:hypothetical protein QUV91_01530 [Actinomyces viscosus]|uniref:Yip1 domain-containing protein n=1 Tax=Actinomyces viscosus TaxID=1656 RepID=A0ABT7TV69_ACTVI|nr:hypothetical protein [Actinomyces viscosus]MDM8075731.1 hypothetical protein [Actinomyces viscosus]